VSSTSAEIQRVCHERGITELVHFTRVQNLIGILQEGLVGRDALKTLKVEDAQVNDHQRMDGYEEAVCLSIGLPNYRMFYRYRRNKPEDWIVLALKPSLLWELDCAFFWENATSSNAFEVPLMARKQAAALRAMFADTSDASRQTLKLPSHYLTDPQAEVLVFEPIPPSCLERVHFHSQYALDRWLTIDVRCWLFKNKGMCLPKFRCSEHYFVPRQDSKMWRRR
jgi:hypothetical protein